MEPKDPLYTISFHQPEFPMNPQLCSLQTYHTSDEKKYISMMKAIFTYRKTVAHAEADMFAALLECLNGK
jgi:hypothetical protein